MPSPPVRDPAAALVLLQLFFLGQQCVRRSPRPPASPSSDATAWLTDLLRNDRLWPRTGPQEPHARQKRGRSKAAPHSKEEKKSYWSLMSNPRFFFASAVHSASSRTPKRTHSSSVFLLRHWMKVSPLEPAGLRSLVLLPSTMS